MKYEVKTGSYDTVDENENIVAKSFKYRTDITTAEKTAFVSMVTDCIITKEHYYSSALETIFNFALIKFFTDIDTSNVLDSNANSYLETMLSIEVFIDSNNVIDVIKTNVREGLIAELNIAIAKDIEYKTGIHNAVFDEVIMDIATTIKDMLSQVDIKSVVETAQKMNSMQQQFTPENIIDAFTESDYFKKSLEKSNMMKAGDK